MQRDSYLCHIHTAIPLLKFCETVKPPNITMTLVRRELVGIGLTIILDLLNASTGGNAVPASSVQLRAVRLELAFQNDLLKEHALQPDHRELVILAGPADEFRFDDRWLVEI